MDKFNKAFAAIIGVEGGYVNDPRDPGGETKYGICKRSYPNVDIKNLTLDKAKEIYKRDFWDSIGADNCPLRLAVFYFDCAVNQGQPVAKKLIQEHLKVNADGIIGAGTKAAMTKALPANDFRFMTARALRYTQTKNFDIYGKGWLNRLFELSLVIW